MSIKLVAVDIDGTLLNNQKEITPEVFSAVQDAKAALPIPPAAIVPHCR